MSYQAVPWLHFVFEALAYIVGVRLFWWQRRQRNDTNTDQNMGWIVVGAILGAALGSKLGFYLERPDLALERWGHAEFLAGKTVLGGFLGGVTGVETAKSHLGITASTGDGFVVPMALGLMIGRLGCFFAGLTDGTFGLPSTLPWAVNFGDGIPRHPTQLYELLFTGAVLGLVLMVRARLPRAGDGFKLFMACYLLWRLWVETLKPRPFLYADLLSGIQIAAILGLIYYLPHLYRIGANLCRPK